MKINDKTKNILLAVSLGFNALTLLFATLVGVHSCNARGGAETPQDGQDTAQAIESPKKAVSGASSGVVTWAFWTDDYVIDYVEDAENPETATSYHVLTSDFGTLSVYVGYTALVEVEPVFADGKAIYEIDMLALAERMGDDIGHAFLSIDFYPDTIFDITWSAQTSLYTLDRYRMMCESYHVNVIGAEIDYARMDDSGFNNYVDFSPVIVEGFSNYVECVISADDTFTPWLSARNIASGDYGLANFGLGNNPQSWELRSSFYGLKAFTFGANPDIYNAIRVTFRPLWSGAKFLLNGEVTTYAYDTGREFNVYVTTKVEFRNAETLTWVNVANAGYGIASDLSTYYTGKLQWTMEQARYLKVYSYLQNPVGITQEWYDGVSEHLAPGFTYVGLNGLEYLGLESATQVEVSGNLYGDVFTLVGSAFGAVAGLFSIQILPYLSLGMLIFAPLVFLVIMAILELLKK